jgi:predicted O-linked N-acetylglucosamine transferase (SPINDLY family)
VLLVVLGRFREAEASYREAIHLDPDYAEVHSNLLFSANYVESLSTGAALMEAKSYGAIVSANAVPKFTRWSMASESSKLRIGFVSGDLKNHPVGYFVEGLLQHIDENKFELYAFTTSLKTDDLTNRLKPRFKMWHSIYGKTELEAANLIHEQGIHILIDLSGHTAHNRLPVFGYKPAPVQVSWLGYFSTTGLPEMDYLLGDPFVTPPSEEHHFTEGIWRMPETYLCFTPPSEAITVAALPALTNGYITFGCFNNLTKMGAPVVTLWSRVLHAMPDSKLFIKTKQLSEKAANNKVIEQFAAHSIAQERLILEGPSTRADLLASYNKVDIALDPFPYPGGTTSAEALWMGVPVLTLKGDRFLSHVGESIAHNVGHPDWVSDNADDYVNKAITFASDLQRLNNTRTSLRNKVLESPLFDAPRFARNFENILVDMWKSRQR